MWIQPRLQVAIQIVILRRRIQRLVINLLIVLLYLQIGYRDGPDLREDNRVLLVSTHLIKVN